LFGRFLIVAPAPLSSESQGAGSLAGSWEALSCSVSHIASLTCPQKAKAAEHGYGNLQGEQLPFLDLCVMI